MIFRWLRAATRLWAHRGDILAAAICGWKGHSYAGWVEERSGRMWFIQGCLRCPARLEQEIVGRG